MHKYGGRELVLTNSKGRHVSEISAQEAVVVHRINALSTRGALALMLERSLRVSNCLLRPYVMLLT